MASRPPTPSNTLGSRVLRDEIDGKTWRATYKFNGKLYRTGTCATEFLAANALAKCGPLFEVPCKMLQLSRVFSTQSGVAHRAYHRFSIPELTAWAPCQS